MTDTARGLLGNDQAAVLARHRDLLTKPWPRRAAEIAASLAPVALVLFAIWWLGISIRQVGPGLVALGRLVGQMFPPTAGGDLALFINAMGETLSIAFVGTLSASVLAIPLGFLAAANTSPNRLVRFAVRRLLDAIRGIDTLIWALVFVGVVGLGPFAGILAIAVSDTGALSKLFSETIEASEARERETVIASGGGPWAAVRFGLLPQVLPIFAGQMLYFFESNTRSATIIGIVGAGGIGLQLSEQIRTYEFGQVALIVLMILVVVAVIDWISGWLRAAMIGRRPASP